MPIDYKEYHPKWKSISRFIRFYRARNRCEWCGVDNGSVGQRGLDGKWYTEREIGGMNSDDGRHLFGPLRNPYKTTKIVLTVAHIDHNKNNNSFFNLAALCQRCHLNHDRKQHIENRRNGRNWKRGQASLFEATAQ